MGVEGCKFADGFRADMVMAGEVSTALAAEVGTEDEPAWNTNTYIEDRTKGHAT